MSGSALMVALAYQAAVSLDVVAYSVNEILRDLRQQQGYQTQQ